MKAHACVLAAAAGLALLAAGPAAAGPRPGEDLTVLGFSADGKRFAVVTAEPGQALGSFRVWDAVSGRAVDPPARMTPIGKDRRAVPPADVLAQLELGEDPGAESYASGTALATDFVSGGVPVHVEVSPRTAAVSVRRGACTREIATGVQGRELNLVSVLRSRDWSSLAVVFKYTDGELRRHGVAMARLTDGPLGEPRCVARRPAQAAAAPRPAAAPPKPAPAARTEARDGAGISPQCLQALRALKGGYSGMERVKDLDGKTEVPYFVLRIEVRGDRPRVVLSSNPGMGLVVCGDVVACQVRAGAVQVSTHDPAEACLDGTVQLRSAAGGALELDHGDVTETFQRTTR